MSTIWPLPKITFSALNQVEEKRPVALITNDAAWSQVGHLLDLPVVVQAEPVDTSDDLLDYLAHNLPSQAEVVYAVGNGVPVAVGKVVAHANQKPLVVVPLAFESDTLFESFAETLNNGLVKRIDTGAASEVVVDWDVIQAAPMHERGAGIVDILAIVTALLDWRYAAKHNRTADARKFSAWGAGVAAGLASQAIKSAKDIGTGDVEGLRTLIDLMMVSVQLSHQLGHDRHEEGTEHYFAMSLKNQGSTVEHAEAVGPGILLAYALHGQDPSPLRDALLNAGVRLDQVRTADAQLALNDLPNFCTVNDLPFGIAHEIDPLSDKTKAALVRAGLAVADDTGDWTPITAPASDTAQNAPTQPNTNPNG